MYHQYHRQRDLYGTVDDGEPEPANNGGVLLWFLIIPLAVIAAVAYFYGIRW